MPRLALQNGVQLYYEQHGSGPELVLIGGISADTRIWAFVADRLAAQYHVTLFDNRGSGQSEMPPGPYTLRMLAQDTHLLLQQLGIAKATVVGHSMGGAIVQQLCLDAPEVVHAAVICASAARMPYLSAVHIEATIALQEAGVAMPLVYNTTYPWIFGEPFLRNAEQMALIRHIVREDGRLQTIAALRAQLHACATADLRPFLPRITTPTLIIGGQHDLLAPLACAKELHQLIPHSRLLIAADCGHTMQLEYPTRFCEAIQQFVPT